MVFDPDTGTRDPNSALYKIANYLSREEVDPSTGETLVRFELVVTNLFQGGAWEEVVPFVFNDGTTNIPEDLPPPVVDDEMNVGLVVGLAVGMSAILAVLIFLFYENKRKQNDAVWKIKKEDIHLGEEPEVIGTWRNLW